MWNCFGVLFHLISRNKNILYQIHLILKFFPDVYFLEKLPSEINNSFNINSFYIFSIISAIASYLPAINNI